MTRRTLLSAAAGASLLEAQTPPIPIIDCHIHLFDTARPQGVPWPPKDNKALYKPALPDRYRKIAPPLGIVGAIEVECSPLVEDNQWVLDLIAKDNLMLGTIGNIEPGSKDFRKHFDKYRKNPLFLGIRYGNLWDRDFRAGVGRKEVIDDIKALAAAGLTMDTANPDTNLIEDLLRLTDKVPELRLVIDHLPKLETPADAAKRKAYESNLQKFAARKLVYVKVSSILRTVNGKIPADVAFYKDRLDHIFGVFGEDRVVYGSDWPNSDNWLEYPAVLKIAKDYFMAKGPKVAEKYFWKNSVAAYRWKKRDGKQPAGV